MTELLFSVIVPVYNVEKYIAECIKSVISQNFDDMEIILIDDGSTDSSGTICDNYKNNYDFIKVLHKTNSGLSAARNSGISVAKGKYLIFLDSDDMLCENALKNLEMCIKKENYPQVIVSRRCDFISFNNKIKECKYYFDDAFNSVSIHKAYDLLQTQSDCLLGAWIFTTQNMYVKENNLYFYEGIYHEDEEWVPRIFFNASQIAYNNNFLYLYRINREGSITASLNINRLFDKLKIIELLELEFSKEKYTDDARNVIRKRLQGIYRSVFYDLYKYRKEDNYLELVNKLKSQIKILRKSQKISHKIVYFSIRFLGINNSSKIFNLLTFCFK